MALIESAKALLESNLWDELQAATRAHIFYEWLQSDSAEQRERLHARLEGVITMQQQLNVLAETEVADG